MPIRRRRTRRVTRPRRTIRGRGWFSNAWSKIKSIIPSWSQIKDKALNFGRQNKVLSEAAKFLGANDNIVSGINSITGMGRRRRTTRRRTTRRRTTRRRTIRGRGLLSLLGLGRRRRTTRRRTTRRRTTRRRTIRGRGFFGDIWSGVKNIGGMVAKPVADLAVKKIIGGRRRRVGRPRMRGRGLFGNIIGGMLPF